MSTLGPPVKAAGPSKAAGQMNIQTYFGFFAEAVLTALGTSLTAQTAQAVNLERVEISTTNTIKLRFSEIETVLLPHLMTTVEVNFVFALSEHDVAGLTRIAGERVPFHTMLEQAVSTAAEPFNFVTKRRNRLTALNVSRNVTGFTAHHLGGEVQYTMATGHFTVPKGNGFAMRLLVTAGGRDLIEDRAEVPATQRALFSIREGAYICRPQWEPPPPPPGLAQGAELSGVMLSAWAQTFLGANAGAMAPRLFQRPTGLRCMELEEEGFTALATREGPPTVARLQLNDDKALELFVCLPGDTAAALLQLSKSGQERFLGDLFRVLYGESASHWEAFAGSPMKWRLLAARQIPVDAMDAVTKRLEGGGLFLRQIAQVDEGVLDWGVAIPPHTWVWMMRATASGMGKPAMGEVNRQAVFSGTGWGAGEIPWKRMAALLSDRDLRDLVRLMEKLGAGPPLLAALLDGMDDALRERWMEAMPQRLGEQARAYRLAAGEGARNRAALTRLLAATPPKRIPAARLAGWMTMYNEIRWGHARAALDELLPLRHLVYGLDRESLARLLNDSRDETLVHTLSMAEFPVIDQVRRATSPRHGMRLLESIAETRTAITAATAQAAQLDLYRACYHGMTRGRYLVRATPAAKLRELLRLLDGE